MKTIIEIKNDDGTREYVKSVLPTIETTSTRDDAMTFDFQGALAVSLALGTLKVPHCMITTK